MNNKIFFSGLIIYCLVGCEGGGSDGGGDSSGAGQGKRVTGCTQLAQSIELQQNVWVHQIRNTCSSDLNTMLASNGAVRNIPAFGTAEYNANSAVVSTFSCAAPDTPRRVSATQFTCDKG